MKALVFSLFFFCTVTAHAAVGFQVGSTCWNTLAEAQNYYFSAQPRLFTNSSTSGNKPDMNYFYFNTTSGLWTRALVTNVSTTPVYYAVTFSTSSCDTTDLRFTNTSAVFDPVVLAAFWSFAMTFVVGVWLLARNIGIIFSAIRRF